MVNSKEKIDFVIPWVDGNDPAWQKEFDKYISHYNKIDGRNFRYRDWNNLQYWFRGVEKFTPWVNKIHFITWGHIPEWLNVNHSKINIVNHSDYIPKENLPIFNANPIEINIHRIKGLSEKFVYFNDDTFLLKPTKPERFFKNGLPCDMAAEKLFSTSGIAHIRLNNMILINNYFNKRKQILKNFSKFFNIKYELKYILQALLLLPFKNFSGFYNAHKPNSFLKSTFNEVWEENKYILDETSKSKFRSLSDINQYLFEYWQLVSGNFAPVSMRDVKSIELSNFDIIDTKQEKQQQRVNLFNNNIDKVVKIIKKQQYRFLCINDGESSDLDFELAKKRVAKAFNQILPEQSSFEK